MTVIIFTRGRRIEITDAGARVLCDARTFHARDWCSPDERVNRAWRSLEGRSYVVGPPSTLMSLDARGLSRRVFTAYAGTHHMLTELGLAVRDALLNEAAEKVILS